MINGSIVRTLMLGTIFVAMPVGRNSIHDSRLRRIQAPMASNGSRIANVISM